MRSEFGGRSQRSKDGAGLRAVENVRAARMMAVPKHGETNTGRHWGPHCESSLPRASFPIYTRFSGSDRASVIVVSCLALSIQIGRRSSQYNS
jgi:hypothetical protein